MFAGSDQRRERFGKEEGVDFVETQFAVLKRVEKFGICAVARAKRFEGQDGRTILAKVRQEQPGEESFAYTCVGAGDEDRSGLHFP